MTNSTTSGLDNTTVLDGDDLLLVSKKSSGTYLSRNVKYSVIQSAINKVITDLSPIINSKANQSDLNITNSNLLLKANQIDLIATNNLVNTKANDVATTASLNLKADKSYVESLVINAQNNITNYLTQTALLAVKPTTLNATAKALDTKKVWYWTRTSADGVTPVVGNWTDTGLSELDLAKDYANANPLFKPVTLGSVAVHLDTLTTAGVYYQLYTSQATPANGYPLAEVCVIFVYSSANTTYQRIQYRTGQQYTRATIGGVFSAFEKVPLSSEVAAINNSLSLIAVSPSGYGNLALNPAATYIGTGINASGAIVASAAYNSAAVVVREGEVISLQNDVGSYTSGRTCAYYSALPVSPATLVAVYTTANKANNSGSYVTSIVPAGAKYLVFNTKVTTDITWNIQRGSVFDSAVASGKLVNTIGNGQPFYIADHSDVPSRLADGNLVQQQNIIFDKYVNNTGIIAAGATFRMLMMPVVEGATYTVQDTVSGFSASMRAVYATSEAQSSSNGVLWTLIDTHSDTIKRFTVPVGLGIKYLFITLKTGAFDVVSTLIINRWRVVDSANRQSVKTIDGIQLADMHARQQLDRLDFTVMRSRFAGKKFVYLGDSITQGTEGGYVKYVTAALMCNPLNRGSSGASANRVVDIITSGLARRDASTSGITWPVVDFTDAAGVSLMIGTNDSTSGITGSLASIPTDRLADNVGNEIAYFERFANDYYGNIGLIIEWIKWKNPLCEIFLISAHRKGTDPTTIEQIIPALTALGNFYSLPYINVTQRGGISYKFIDTYSIDKTHMNVVGNQVLGNYIATKILAGG